MRYGGGHLRPMVRRMLVSASCVAVCASAAPALAQSPTNNIEAAEGTPDIVVTAQMRSQNVQSIPLSITAVNGELLEARSQDRLDEITAQAPSVQLQRSPSGNSMSAFIRGVGQGDASPSVEPGVGIYVDDIYFGSLTASTFDLVDIDRVEVLRGPQGTLAGMNSQGGAIKIYSRTAEGKGGFVEGSLGNLGRRDFRATADFTLVEDAVFARLTGVSRNRNGHVTRYDYACINPTDPAVVSRAIPRLAANGDCELGRSGSQKVYGIRGALRIAPTGSPLEINVIADYTKDESSANAITLVASAESASKGTAAPVNRSGLSVPYQGVAFDDRFVTYGKYRRPSAALNDFYASYANFYDPGVTYMAANAVGVGGQAGAPNGPFIAANASGAEAWGISGTIDYEFNENFALKSITGYRAFDSLNGQDNDNSPVVFIQNTDWFTFHQFSEELRFSGKLFDDKVTFTVGGIYFDSWQNALSRIHTPFSGYGPPDKPTFSFLNDDIAKLRVLAGFGNASWQITDRLSFEGGIRATNEKKDYEFGRTNPNGIGDYLPLSNPSNPLTGFVGQFKGTIVDYRAVLSYMLTDQIMTYAQFSTGHKAGGISPRPYTASQIRSFGPEKLRSYEVGFKSDLFDRLIRLNADAFYMEYIGYQGTPNICLDASNQPLPPSNGGISGFCGQYLNIGDAEVKGFELETTIRPAPGFTIDGSLSYVDFKFTKINYPTTSIIVGATRPGIGDWKWSIGAQYQFDVGSAGSLTPRIDVNYTPGYCGNFTCDPNGSVEDYTIANARLTYRSPDKDWSVALEATNLFQKKYYINKFFNVFYVSGQPGRPREVAVTVRRQF